MDLSTTTLYLELFLPIICLMDKVLPIGRAPHTIFQTQFLMAMGSHNHYITFGPIMRNIYAMSRWMLKACNALLYHVGCVLMIQIQKYFQLILGMPNSRA